MKTIAMLMILSGVSIVGMATYPKKPSSTPVKPIPAPVVAAQIKAQQFSIPSWAASPVQCVNFGLSADGTGWWVGIPAWELYAPPIPNGPDDPRTAAAMAAGKNCGAFYFVQGGFPDIASAQAWAVATFPLQAPATKWRFAANAGGQVP